MFIYVHSLTLFNVSSYSCWNPTVKHPRTVMPVVHAVRIGQRLIAAEWLCQLRSKYEKLDTGTLGDEYTMGLLQAEVGWLMVL